MANSKHYGIVAAVVALMGTPSAVADLVLQDRSTALASDRASQIHVNLANADPNDIGQLITGAPIDWDSEVEIAIKTRASAGKTAEQLADEIWADAYGRVMADQTLGGLCAYLEVDAMTVDLDEAEVGVTKLTWRFIAKHRTTQNAIT